MSVEEDLAGRISRALAYAARFGQIDGDHHKAWVIDQMVRQLTGDEYEEWVKEYEGPDPDIDPEETYEWDTGIAP